MPGYGGSSAVAPAPVPKEEAENFVNSNEMWETLNNRLNITFYVSLLTLVLVSYPLLRKLV
tara:strand:+ start:511 stop:693 length:183 start_codon:yes stop_codon:yes gene_type:complete